MASVKNGRNGKSNLKRIIGIIIFALILGLAIYEFIYKENNNTEINSPIAENLETESNVNTVGQNEANIPDTEEIEDIQYDGQLILTMIDVGQADCFLLQQGDKTAMIDCGTRSSGKNAVEYLKNMGITYIDYVFGTHPHEDHMGGMYDIITNFEIGKIIMPKVDENITTNWYIKLLNEIVEGEFLVCHPTVGEIYNLGDATIKVIGPLSPANGNKNNYSTVLKVSYGEMDIIMTGDAEKEVEKDILMSGVDIDAEILKMGHHGSDTSNTDEFIDAISPDYGLISCGVGNKYKHPNESTMEKLKKRNITVFRTDENSTVVAIVTNKDVTFDCEPGDYLSGPQLSQKEDKQ